MSSNKESVKSVASENKERLGSMPMTRIGTGRPFDVSCFFDGENKLLSKILRNSNFGSSEQISIVQHKVGAEADLWLQYHPQTIAANTAQAGL